MERQNWWRIPMAIMLAAMFCTLLACAKHVDYTAETESEATPTETTELRFSPNYAEGDDFAPYLTPGLDYLTLVNKGNPYDFNGEYERILQENLSYFADTKDGDLIALDNGARVAFTMLSVYLDNNYDLQIGAYDGYRDYETQRSYYANYLKVMYGELEDCPGCNELRDWYKGNPMPEPGYSEAHTGLLINVLIKHDRDVPAETELIQQIGYEPDWVWYTETPERTETIKRFRVLHEHLADFGFIDRFPAGKENWTGMPSEPYQIRFVGSSKVAHEIMDHGLSLEEYLGETKEYDINTEPSDETLREYLGGE